MKTTNERWQAGEFMELWTEIMEDSVGRGRKQPKVLEESHYGTKGRHARRAVADR